MNRVAVKTGVEVHGDLNQEDERQDGPFLLLGEAEAKLVVAVSFRELDLAITEKVSTFLASRSEVLCGGRSGLDGIGAVGAMAARTARHVFLGHSGLDQRELSMSESVLLPKGMMLVRMTRFLFQSLMEEIEK